MFMLSTFEFMFGFVIMLSERSRRERMWSMVAYRPLAGAWFRTAKKFARASTKLYCWYYSNGLNPKERVDQQN
jgi:hypothetical protein